MFKNLKNKKSENQIVNTNQLKTTTFYLNGDQVGWRTLNYLDHSGNQQVMYVLGAYV